MDILRTIAHQPVANNKMCEHAHNKAAETRRGKPEDSSAHATQEMSRIISDCTTGKCYCRGKVLGKVGMHWNVHKAGTVTTNRGSDTICFVVVVVSYVQLLPLVDSMISLILMR